MAYLPDTVPSPEPLIDDAEFWEHCSRGELRFQRCVKCSCFRQPPTAICRRCGATESEWVMAEDEAELYSYTVVNYPSYGGIEPALPYNVAIVIFPSFDNLRLISNVIDVKPEDMKIGMKLSLVWEKAVNGALLPRFRRKVAA